MITSAVYSIWLSVFSLFASTALFGQSQEIGLQLLTPNSGEILTPGSEYRISWSDTASDPMRYQVDYSLDGGLSWNMIEEEIRLKEYRWYVPYSLSDSCLIKVTAYADSNHFVPVTTQPGTGMHWVEYDPTGSMFVISSWYSNVFIWNAKTGKLLLDVNNSGYVPVARFNRDGKMLATIDVDSLLVVYNTTTGSEVVRINTPSEVYHHIEFVDGPGGASCLAASGRGSVQIFDISSGNQIDVYAGYEVLDAISHLALILLYDRNEDILQVVNLSNGSLTPMLYSRQSEIISACLSNNGLFVAIGTKDGDTQVFEVATGELLHWIENSKIIHHVEFSPNDSLLLSCSNYTNVVKIIKVESGELLHEIVDITPIPIRPPPYLRGAHFGPDGESILTYAGNDGFAYAHLWEAPNWSLSREYWHNSNYMAQALINPDGSGVLTVEFSKAYIWPFDISKVIGESSSNLFRIGYTVGVEDAGAARGNCVEIFPLPAIDHVIVKCKDVGLMNAEASFRVFCSDGREVSKSVIVHRIDGDAFLVELSHLERGAYIIVQENERDLLTFHVVVE